jgi:cyanophycinase
MPGVLALVGGAEWTEGCTFDRDLLAASGASEVLVLPTAAAYERPERAVETASAWFASLGAKARGLMVLRRPDAEDPANVEAVRASSFIYLGGGSPLHLRSVLKDSSLWSALESAWQGGAVLAASSAGAMALGDPMVDPRGGAYTLGLGLVEQLAVIPHFDAWSADKAHRTMELAPAGVAVVGIEERTALIRTAAGAWETAGAGRVDVFRDGKRAGLEALPGGAV